MFVAEVRLPLSLQATGK